MEQILTEHIGVILVLLATVLTAVSPVIYGLGRLSARVDRHEDRLDLLEEKKVDEATFKAIHESLLREITGLRQDIQRLQDTLNSE